MATLRNISFHNIRLVIFAIVLFLSGTDTYLSAQSGCTNPVKIWYDANHVPHIFGDSDAAAFYGLGYTQMNDFPVTTLANIWESSGKSAEIFGNYNDGPATNTQDYYLGFDKRIWQWDVPNLALAHEASMDSTIKGLLDAYVAGINKRRDEWFANYSSINTGAYSDTETPVKPAVLARLFDPAKTITRLMIIQHGLRMNGPLAGGTGASNAWLVGRKGTQNGPSANRQYVVADPHLDFYDQSFRGYFVEVHGPTYRVTGWTMPGMPCVAIGFNEQLAWTMTTIFGANIVQNTWQVAGAGTNGSGVTTFLLDNDPLKVVTVQTATQALKYWDYQATPPALVNVTNTALTRLAWVPQDNPNVTGRYPIISVNVGGVYIPDVTSLATQGSHDFKFMQSAFSSTPQNLWEWWIKLGLAQSVGTQCAPPSGSNNTDSVFTSNSFTLLGGQNMLIGDINGRMQFVRLSRVPIQGATAISTQAWNGEMDGKTSGYRWTGFHRYCQIPILYGDANTGPSGGTTSEVWINTNTSPDLTTTPEPNFGATFPDYMWPNGNPALKTIESWRRFRVAELLQQHAPTSTLTDVTNSAFDQKDNWGAKNWQLFKAAYAYVPSGSQVAVSGLITWLDSKASAEGFMATRDSEHSVYLHLLRGEFRWALMNNAQASLAEKNIGMYPGAPFPTPDPNNPGGFLNFSDAAGSQWEHVVTALVSALTTVANNYFAAPCASSGSCVPKLSNYTLYTLDISPSVPSLPWNDYFPDDSATKGVQRWGQVHMNMFNFDFNDLLATEDIWRGSPFVKIPALVNSKGGDFVNWFVDLFYGGYPGTLLGNARVFPVGGTLDSVFVSVNTYYGPGSGIAEAQFKETVHAFTADPLGANASDPRWFYLVPASAGTRLPLVTELPDPTLGLPVRGYYLAAVGGTEKVHDANRYVTCDAYSRGLWTEIKTAQSDFPGTPAFCLPYP